MEEDVIVISRSWPLFREKLSYFTTENEIQKLVSELSWNEILRIRHTAVDISRMNKMIYKGVLRTWYIDLNKDLEQIFQEMKKITRREIRRAEDMLADIEVRVNDDRAQKDFRAVYNNFVKQKGHTYKLSLNRYKQYLNVGDIFVLYYKGQPYAASLDMPDYTTKRVYGVFLGSNRLNNPENNKIASYLNRYLYWYEIRTYKDKGFEVYDFGGGGEQKGSRSWFKQSFGGSVMEEYQYVFAGAMITYLLGKTVMKGMNLINKLRLLSNNFGQ